MDPFAQSRADDDLFADEFEPVSEPTVVVEQPQTATAEESKPATVDRVSHTNGSVKPRQQDRRQDRKPRGGRGGSNQNGMSNSRFAPQADSTPKPSQSSDPAPQSTNTESTTAEPSQPNQNAAPAPEPPSRPLAVRGDRSATGGPAHKKLTEEELAVKMEQMAILNAKKAERHRLSEADQAAFQHREKELAKERREKAVVERKNERLMEMERAKNRERKMKAQGGREWDSEKTDADIVDRKGRSSEYVRGGHGGVIRGGSGLSGSRFASQGVEGEESRPAGRGAFEPRGRGRGGRGGRGGGKGIKVLEKPVPSAEDFPPLSSAAMGSPSPGGDWAEEMATPVEEKKLTLEGEKA